MNKRNGFLKKIFKGLEWTPEAARIFNESTERLANFLRHVWWLERSVETDSLLKDEGTFFIKDEWIDISQTPKKGYVKTKFVFQNSNIPDQTVWVKRAKR